MFIPPNLRNLDKPMVIIGTLISPCFGQPDKATVRSSPHAPRNRKPRKSVWILEKVMEPHFDFQVPELDLTQ